MNTGLLLTLAATCLALGIIVARVSATAWLVTTVTGVTAGLASAVRVLAGDGAWEWRNALRVGGEALHLRLDAISALFLALLCVVAGAGAVYASEYWSDAEHPRSAGAGRRWWNLLVLGLGIVLLAANGIHFLVGWETFTISAYFLVTLDRDHAEVRRAGWLYLAVSHVAVLLLFAFFALLAIRTGSWELGPMRGRADLAPLFWLMLVGFGIKAGVFPLHIWLPSAHANAPSHVSAIMSGAAIKMGVYGILRFSGWLPVPNAAGWVVIGFGAVSALLGIAFAFAQGDLKRLLAYCSVENVGIILVGVGGAMLASTAGDAVWGRLLLAGALLHVWNHGLFKGLLFMGAGSVLHATGTRELSRLGGLWRRLPWTSLMFAVGVLAVAGLPPLNGFVSEWLVYLGLFDAVTSRGPSAWAAIFAALLLGTAGALALASFVKVGATVFLGAPRGPAAAKAHESGRAMLAPMGALAALCVTLGLAPTLAWPAIARGVAAWHPAWPATAAPLALQAIGGAQLALATLLIAGAIVAWHQWRGKLARRALTWDCGYAVPTARMQYSSASFAGIVTGWFRWILWPRLALRRPRGLLPARALRLERIPETVLELVIAPVGALFLQTASGARRLQHGSLQAYILYVVVALAALGAMVLEAGAR